MENKVIVYTENHEVKREVSLKELIEEGSAVAKGTDYDGWTTSDYIHATAIHALIDGIPAVSYVQFKVEKEFSEVQSLVVLISGGAHISTIVHTSALDFMDGVYCSAKDAEYVLSSVIRAFNDNCVRRDRDRILAGSVAS